MCTSVLSRVGLRERSCANAPATIGVAIEVPVSLAEDVSLTAVAEGMLWPGAMMSTQGPKFEKLVANESAEFDAATVIASGSRPGLEEHASVSSLPAAATSERPAACAT